MGLFGSKQKIEGSHTVGGEGNIVVQAQNVAGSIIINQAHKDQIARVVSEYFDESGISREAIDNNQQFDIPIPKGILSQINCDRRAFAGHFHSHFRRTLPRHKLFVLQAEAHQHPASLTERFVLELEEKHQFQVFRPTAGDRLQLATLPHGVNAEDGAASFCEHLESVLQLDRNHLATLADFYKLDTGLHNYRYIAIPIEIRSSQWEEYMPEFLDWLVGTFFKCNTDAVPGFLLFFNIYYESGSKQAAGGFFKQLFGGGKSIRDTISGQLLELQKRHDAAVVFDPLPGVPIGDLKAWFRHFVKNEKRIHQIINTIVARNTEELEQALVRQDYAANDDFELDMATVELILEDIIKNNRPQIIPS